MKKRTKTSLLEFRLIRDRLKTGCTIKEYASDYIGITYPTYRSVVQSFNPANTNTYVKIAKRLNMEPSQVYKEQTLMIDDMTDDEILMSIKARE